MMLLGLRLRGIMRRELEVLEDKLLDDNVTAREAELYFVNMVCYPHLRTYQRESYFERLKLKQQRELMVI